VFEESRARFDGGVVRFDGPRVADVLFDRSGSLRERVSAALKGWRFFELLQKRDLPEMLKLASPRLARTGWERMDALGRELALQPPPELVESSAGRVVFRLSEGRALVISISNDGVDGAAMKGYFFMKTEGMR
jgi:hypothetical protein